MPCGPKDYTKPEYPPLLAPGFHVVTVESLRELCVSRFRISERRDEIMRGFEAVVAILEPLRLDGEYWIDGSFLTEDLNPGDVDFALRIPAKVYDEATGEARRILQWFDEVDLRPQYCCDCNLLLHFQEDDQLHAFGASHTAHMQKIFSESLRGVPKGVAVIPVGSGLR